MYMSIKHVIWDWNGTLLDDIDVSMDALNVILKKKNLASVDDKEEYRRYFQFPVIEYYKKVGFDFNKTSFEELAKDYMAYYQPNSLQCHLHNGAQDILDHLQHQGYRQYLLSASNVNFLHEQVAQYDIAPYFDNICGLDNIHAHSKAQLAKRFVEDGNFNKEEVLFIGDSVHDSEVAHHAGCHCVLIANGHEHKDKLIATSCPVINDIREITQILEA